MSGPRVESTFATLADGRVFVVGGFAVPGELDGLLASAELYDPTTSSWTGAGSMSITRFVFTATSLADGRVLVAGGIVVGDDVPNPNGVTSSAELYDPASGG
jgi:N-acetylneuraminic acid mutarotase